jgi:alkanesulfonate monooxygenase SsuD/methylene tetrahydromethanopterin reductase-like flavin-dependent oxidoreductase (luciferase family)
MENFNTKRQPEREQETKVRGIAERLFKRLPDGKTSERLKSDLTAAIDAARSRNGRAMEDAFASAMEGRNVLAGNGVDVLEQLEDLVEQIRTFKTREL